ncbi:MAG: ROK family protein [Bacteroidia bacterium]|nr:ROK family protein [Bacteroidia bacterium]
MKVAAGIDIGGTNSVFGIVDSGGNCINSGTIDTELYDDPEKFVSDVYQDICGLMEQLPAGSSLEGIGIGAPKGNYFNGCIEYASNLKWKGKIPLAGMFRKYVSVPVVLTNDANAAAVGEMLYGAAKGMKDFILITLGTGVGSGIVINGQLVYGHDGFAGELGHTIIDPEGRMCSCGRKGCLETYTSARGIKQTARELLETSNTESILRSVPPESISSRMIADAALQNDQLALKVFDFTGKMLGLKLSDAVAFSSPEAIILFGGVALAGDLILKPAKKYMEEYLLPVYRNKVKIIPSMLYAKNAAVLGAASLAWNEINGNMSDEL